MDDRQTVVLASGNAGKLRELERILAPLDLSLRPQTELGVAEAPETGLTFIENALIKARAAAAHTGLPAIADDSGLEVAALRGAPGIYSARYAGDGDGDEANNRKLLQTLAEMPGVARDARFYCVLVYLRHAEDPTPLVCEGSWRGEILSAPRGADGFGYDPLFYVPTEGCTAAELPRERKNRISHRAQACARLLEALRRIDG